MAMNFYPRKRRVPQIMIVSMIDIFAILLIFVIVTTTFKVPSPEQPAVTIKLPESKSASDSSSSGELAVLEIQANEAISFDHQIVALADLSAVVKKHLAQKPKQALAMRADEKISYGFLIKVLDALKEAGVQGNLSAFTEKKK
jgi:biopolymer transport protein ExbD